MERNLRLLPAYKAARDALFWLPVFFLYLSSKVSVAEVLVLEAIYYAGVVALEVPSGYFSDRIGRRITLVLAAAATTLAHVLFFFGEGFTALALAQLLLAAGMAFNSGTDSALLYDSLEQLDRKEEFDTAMAKMQSLAFASTGAAALVGGLSASFDLRMAYALSAIASAVSLLCATVLREPDRRMGAAPPIGQLRAVLGKLRTPKLAWVFAFAVGMTIFDHIPYELVQPYVRLVLEDFGGAGQFTPAATGALAFAGLIVAAVASRRAVDLRRRFGLAGTLLGAALLQGVIMVAMGATVHGVILVVVVLRSASPAVTHPIVDATVLPVLEGGTRATYLSVQSLAGRLAFACSLSIAAGAVGDLAQLDAPGMRGLSLSFAAALAVFVAVLFAVRRALAARTEE